MANGSSAYHRAFVGRLLAELGADSSGERAGFARTDYAGVDFHDRNHFGRGAGKEYFIRIPDVVARYIRFNYRDFERRGDFKRHLAGDAHQGTGVWGRRDQPAFVNQEDVIAGALGDITLLVEHEAFVEAVLLGFDLRQNVIQVVKGLDGGRERRWADPARGGGDDPHARRVELFRVQLDGIRDADDGRLGAILWGKSQVADAA